MPRAYSMSWEGSPYFRFVKMHKGTRYRVSCSELGLPRDHWTKEAGGVKANEWWESTLHRINADAVAAHPNAPAIARTERREDYAERHGLNEEAKAYREETERLRDFPDERPLPESQTVQVLWRDRLGRDKATPTDRTIGAHFARYIADRQSEARQGVRSDESASGIRKALVHFVTHVGESKPVDSINAEVWHKWFVHCSAQVVLNDKGKGGWSAFTANVYFVASRAFVRDLYTREVLDNLPRNLSDRKFRFERPDKPIPTFSKDEVRVLLNAAIGIHRLLLLLMLNTGMTAKDIGDLRRDQVDLDTGRITRRRSKTNRKKSSRLVSYILWEETRDLLKAHMATDGELALVTQRNGKPWVRTETREDGKLVRCDNVASVFNELKRRVNMTGDGKSVKVFRKTSATELRKHPVYKDVRRMFLGHSETAMSDRHYAETPQADLDNAVLWLRSQFLGTKA